MGALENHGMDFFYVSLKNVQLINVMVGLLELSCRDNNICINNNDGCSFRGPVTPLKMVQSPPALVCLQSQRKARWLEEKVLNFPSTGSLDTRKERKKQGEKRKAARRAARLS